jgi:hypothetical protein
MIQDPSPPNHLAEPDLKIAGLELWLQGRENPDADNFWDGNWLRVTAECRARGARVSVEGPILMVTDVERFGSQCELLHQGERREATLGSYEPALSVVIKTLDGQGHLRVQVDITPDQLVQAHRMEFELDQTYLPGIIRACAAIVAEFPIRGRSTDNRD